MKPPGELVATYFVIGVPPFEMGGFHATFTRPRSPGKARTPVGAPAGPETVMIGLAAEALLSPCEFDDVTVNAYAVPFTKFGTVAEVDLVVYRSPPGDTVIV